MSTETIARRYSAALADVVLKTGEAEAVKAELANWGELFRSNNDLQTVFSNPAINHANKEKVLEGLIAKTKPTKTTANFVRVLLQNGRLIDLADINERFATVLEERGGVVIAKITSARDLPVSERADFENSLAKLTGKKVTVNYTVDKNIIGGVVTRIGSTVYDGSVKTKLENLKAEMIGAK
jgi:F-type H+-transporting ATPase subunit delta